MAGGLFLLGDRKMPLSRASEQTVDELDGIWFGMRDSDTGQPVRCVCRREGLQERGATDQDGQKATFLRDRFEIEELASALYDRRGKGDLPVVVTSRDLNPEFYKLTRE
jgi:hypothetical protein